MRSSIKKYLCVPRDNPLALDGYMNTEYIYVYDLDSYFYFGLTNYSDPLKRRRINYCGLLYDRLPFEEDKECLGYWFRRAKWSDEVTPMEAFIPYLAPYK